MSYFIILLILCARVAATPTSTTEVYAVQQISISNVSDNVFQIVPESNSTTESSESANEHSTSVVRENANVNDKIGRVSVKSDRRNEENAENALWVPTRQLPNYTDLFSLENMLTVFDARLLVKQWGELQKVVNGQCQQDIQKYVQGLQAKAMWALKMEDASGRYPSMFYWGNNYWIGSLELCQILNDQQAPAKQRNQSTSPLFGAWHQDVSSSGLGLPFLTAFYNVRIAVAADIPELIETQRTVYLGLCLPHSCSRHQVADLVNAARAPALHQTVLEVRSPDHATYSYFNDPGFYILLLVSVVTAVLLLAGTAYDVMLSRRIRSQTQRFVNMVVDGSAVDMRLESNGKSKYDVNVSVSNKNSEENLAAETPSSDEELKLSVKAQLLLSFSIKANVLQIFDQSVGADTLAEVHGLRVVSIVWIVLGHTSAILFKYTSNSGMRAMLQKSLWFQLIPSAAYSCDTFFCLSGILVSFLYFRTDAKGKLARLTQGRSKLAGGLLQFLGLSFYRFARLTVPYMYVLGVVAVTAKWGSDHALFTPPLRDHVTCPQYWWRNLLYINTLFPSDEMCMLWSWYLANDALFYTIGAAVLILATYHFRLSAMFSVLLFLSSVVTTGYVSWSNEQVPNSDDPFTQFDKVYDKPWTRLGPFVIGMVTGWILFKTDLKIRMKKVWAVVGWATCVSLMLFIIFGLYDSELSVGVAAAHNALSHSVWAACLCWIIIACATGYGGWLQWLLSAPILYPLSRVTYCTYLVHPVVLHYIAMLYTQPIHLTKMYVFIFFLGLMAFSYFLGFVLSVAFEAPVITMLKILSPQKRPHRV